jgi:hypothetical protein
MWCGDPKRHRRLAIELAHRGLNSGGADPLVLAHTAMALMITGEDRSGDVALIDRAIALNPNFSNAWL